MKFSISKTESVKACRTPSNLSIDINNIKLKQVNEFKYLGNIFTEDRRLTRETDGRLQKADNTSYQVLAPTLETPQHPN